MFYQKFGETYSWLPARVIESTCRDATRSARSFRELRKRGRAYTDKPEARRVAIIIL